VDPYTPSTLYLGTDLGLLISTDSGATWAHDPGLPDVIIEELGFEATNSWLFAYTFGRGVYRTQLPGAAALSCTYSADATPINADRFGGTFPVSVTTQAGCAWAGFPGSGSSFAPIQSPAQGMGNGAAFVTMQPNLTSSAANGTLMIAGTPVPVSQAAGVFQNVSSDLVATAALITVPAMVRVDTRSRTSSPGDPVHSCTGSADYKTVWWQVTPTDSGFLKVLVRGDRLDVFGDFGIVVTAYPQNDLTQELGCAIVPKNATARTTTWIQFAVSVGTTYLIEVATSGGNTAQDGGNANLVVTTGVPAPVVTVSPSTAAEQPGGSPIQFSAQVDNASNTAVRWSVTPPIGFVSPSGIYTPPASVAGATTVTITATSFADPTKTSNATVTITPTN
jgi:hypothetical protein